MKVILVALPGEITVNGTVDETIPLLSIYLLGACIQARCYQVEILDSSKFKVLRHESILNTLNERLCSNISESDIVCFSCNTFNWSITKLACSIIKTKIRALTIVGGLHPSFFYKHIMNTTDIDYIFRGEGEYALPNLIDAICNKGDFSIIEGLSFRHNGLIHHNRGNGVVDLMSYSKLPLPLFEQIPEGVYKVAPVETSRGCLFSCCFCSIPFRRNRRIFELEEIKRRVEQAKQYASIFKNKRVINFADDCFTHDPDRIRKISDMLSSSSDGFSYFIEARINDLLNENILDFLYPEWLNGMQIGVECGYDEGIQLVGKGTDVKRLYQCIELLFRHGLSDLAFFSFIIGFPWETEVQINMTLDTIEDLCDRFNIKVTLNWLIPLPSRLWNQRKKYGIDLDETLFDKIGWILEEDYFKKAHPRIDEIIFNRVEKRIMQIQLKGAQVAHPIPEIGAKLISPHMFKGL